MTESSSLVWANTPWARRCWIVTSVIVLVVSAAIASMAPDVSDDPAWGLLAAEQKLQGRSSSVMHVVAADARDMAHDTLVLVSWWAPGQQQLYYLIRKFGYSPGTSLRAIVMGAWLIGITGWGLYFAGTGATPVTVAVMLAFVALFRMSHYNGFTYTGGEMLLWSGVPWVAAINLRAQRDTSSRANDLILCIVAGASVAGLGAMKHSAFLLMAGFGIAWIAVAWRSRRLAPVGGWLIGFLAGCAALYWAFWRELVSAATPGTPGLCSSSPVKVVIWNALGPLIGLTDFPDAVNTVGTAAGLASLVPALTMVALAVIATVFSGWLYWTVRVHVSRPAALPLYTIGVSCALVVATGVMVLMLRGGCVSFEARHHQYGALLLMPVFGQAVATTWRHGAKARAWTAMAVAVLLVFPAAYGTAALAQKALLRWPRVAGALSKEGLRLDFVGERRSTPAFQQELETLLPDAQTIVVTPFASVALAFASHRLLITDSSERPFFGRASGGVMLVMPYGPSTDDLTDMKRRFIDITHWREMPMRSAPTVSVWLGSS